ncbi:hypothetical protein LQZ21_10725 [Treponema sp. TIM-1]|uniref:response regulator transcription factor n=1 Tax=Treponema sp. TIM-1 TaxID=2898417 RepID=UPI0039814B7F
MIKIVMIDSQELSRQGMELFLSPHNDFKIIGYGKDDYEAIKLTAELHPDVVLMDTGR